MPRSTMASLIARVKAMCGGDTTTLADDDYQQLLDDHAVVVNGLLAPEVPFYTTHAAPFENLESGSACKIFYGYNTLLVENVDYTADYGRGIFTTPAADYRGLRIQGTAYDVYAAAADGWERLAATHVGEVDIHGLGFRSFDSQAHDQALKMVAKYRAKAWATSHTIERADTPAQQDGASYHEQLVRRARRSDIPA